MPRLYLATILRPDHVYGIQGSRVWHKSRFLEHSIGRRQHASAWELSASPVPFYITIAMAG
jgi:hypothetical protein